MTLSRLATANILYVYSHAIQKHRFMPMFLTDVTYRSKYQMEWNVFCNGGGACFHVRPPRNILQRSETAAL